MASFFDLASNDLNLATDIVHRQLQPIDNRNYPKIFMGSAR
jgi:hypothetical protein